MTKRFLLLTAVFLLAGNQVFAVVKNAVTSGNWSNGTIWSPAGVPAAGDAVIINDGVTVTVDVTTNALLSLQVGQGTSGILQYHNGSTAFSVNVSGSVTVNAGGIFRANTAPTIAGTHALAITNGSIINNGTIDFAESVNGVNSLVNTTISGTTAGLTYSGSGVNTFNNFTQANTAATPGFTLAASMNLNGLLTINTTCFFGINSHTLTISGTGTAITNTGTFNVNTGTVVLNGVGAQTLSSATMPNINNLTVNKSGGSVATVSTSTTVGSVVTLTSGTLSVGGVVLTLNGTIAGTGTGTISTLATSTIVIGGASGGNFGSLRFTSPGQVLGTFTISRTGASPSVDISSGNLFVQTALNLTSGSITGSGTGSMTLGVGTNALTTTVTNGTIASSLPVNYNLGNLTYNLNYNNSTAAYTTGQEMPSLTATAPNAGTLSINNNQSVTLGNDGTVFTVSITNVVGNILKLNGKTLRFAGTFTNAGATANTTGLDASVAGSKLKFIGSAAQNFTFNNQTFSGVVTTPDFEISGTNTLTGLSVVGTGSVKNLTINSGSTLTVSATTLNVGVDFTNNGIMNSNGTAGILTMAGGATAQSISGSGIWTTGTVTGSFYGFGISNALGLTPTVTISAGQSFAVQGALNLTAGTIAGAGIITLGNATANSLTVTVTNGILPVANAAYNLSGATFTVNYNTSTSPYTTAGEMPSATATAPLAGVVTINNTQGVTLGNSGTIYSLVINGGDGIILHLNGKTLRIAGGLTNNGLIANLRGLNSSVANSKLSFIGTSQAISMGNQTFSSVVTTPDVEIYSTSTTGANFNTTAAAVNNLTIAQNAYMQVIGVTVSVAGNIDNNGILFSDGANTGSLINMNGTSAQTIQSSLSTGSWNQTGTNIGVNRFPGLTINNAAGVVLNQNIALQTTLNLTSGILSGSGTLTLGVAAGIITTTRTNGALSLTTAYSLNGVTYNVNYNSIAPSVGGITTGTELPPTSYLFYKAGQVTINNPTANGGVVLGVGSNINNLSISALTTLDLNGNTLGIFTTYTNNGILNASNPTSTLVFNGTATQTFSQGILATSPNDFISNITVTNTAGVTFTGSSLAIGSAVQSVNGVLNLGTGTVTTFGGGIAPMAIYGTVTGSGTVTFGNTSTNLTLGGSAGNLGTINLTNGAQSMGVLTVNITGTNPQVTFNGNLTLASAFTLTSGVVNMGGYVVNYTNTSTTPMLVANQNSSSYFAFSGVSSGLNWTMNSVAAGTYRWNIGYSNTAWRPITIQTLAAAAATSNVKLGYTAAIAGTAYSATDITAAGNIRSNYIANLSLVGNIGTPNITMEYQDADFNTAPTAANVKIWYYNRPAGTATNIWTSTGTQTSNGTNGSNTTIVKNGALALTSPGVYPLNLAETNSDAGVSTTTYYWTGTTSTAWNGAVNNWNPAPGAVANCPGLGTATGVNVIIPQVTNQPTATGLALSLKDITVSNGAILTLATTTVLTLSGDFYNYNYAGTSNGLTFTTTGSGVTYTGTSKLIAPGNYYNLIFSAATSPILSPVGTISVANTFTPVNSGVTYTGSTINFNSTGAQSIPAFNFFNNVIFAATTSNTIGGNISVFGDMKITTATFQDGTRTITGPGTSSGKTLTLSGTSIYVAGYIGTNALPQFQNYNIASGTRIDFQAANTAVQTIPSAVYGSVTFTNGGTVAKTAGGPITVKGTFTISSGRFDDGNYTISLNSHLTNNAVTPASSGITTSGGTVVLEGGTAVHNIFTTAGTAVAFGNLELNDAAGATFSNTTATTGGTVVSGNLTCTKGNLAINAFTTSLQVNGTTNIASNGTIQIGSTTGTKTFTGNLTNNGQWNNSSAEAISFGGSIINNGQFVAGTGLYTLTGAGKDIDGTSALRIPSITITGSYTNKILTSNGGFSVSTAISPGTGSLTQNPNTLLKFAGSGAITAALNASATGNTVNYNGTTAAVKGTSYYNLSFTPTALATATLGAATTVSNNLTITSPNASSTATFADGGFLLTGPGTGAGTLDMSGSFPTVLTLNNASLTPVSPFPTFQNYNFHSTASTVNFNAAVAQDIAVATVSPSFGNLSILGAGIKRLMSNVTVKGNLTITTGSFQDNNNTLTVNGNVTNNGGAASTSNGKVLLTGGSLYHVLSGAGAYGNLALDDAQGAYAAGSFTVNNNLNLNNGTLYLCNTSLTGTSLTLGASSSLTTGSGMFAGVAASSLTINGTGNLGGDVIFASGWRNLGSLTMNRASSGIVNLGSDLMLHNAGGLMLTATTGGLLNLGNNNLTFNYNATLSGTPSATSMIVADATGGNTGRVYKIFPAGTSTNFTFPIGDNTSGAEYSPFLLSGFTAVGANRTIGVNVVDAVHPDLTLGGTEPQSNYLTRYWDVADDNAGSGYTFTGMTLNYLAADNVGTINATNDQINRYDGAAWWQMNSSTVSTTQAVTTTPTYTQNTAPLNGSEFTLRGNPAKTYEWVPTSGYASWIEPTNWNPVRTTPAATDILLFNQGGSSTTTRIPSETVAQILFSNNTDVTFTSAAASTLTLNGATATNNLSIAAGSKLSLGASVTLTYATTASQWGNIAGTLNVNPSGVLITNAVGTTVVTVASGGTVVNNGGTLTGSNPTLTFGAGSNFISNFNVNAGAITIPTAFWNTTSTCYVQGITNGQTVAFGSQSMGNVVHDCPNQLNGVNYTGSLTTVKGDYTLKSCSTFEVRFTATTGLTCNITGNLIVQSGNLVVTNGTATPIINVTGNVDLQGGIMYLSGSTGLTTLNITGNMVIKSGATFNGNQASTAVSVTNLAGNFDLQSGGTFTNGTTTAQTFNFTGTSGTSTFSNAGTFTSTYYNFNINTPNAVLTLLSDIPIATGRSFVIGANGGRLNCGSFKVSGAGTFTLTSDVDCTLGINSPDGIALLATGLFGNIQTTTARTYGALANYVYGSAPTKTGDGLTAANTVTFNGPTLDLTSACSISGTTGAISLTNTLLSLGSNNLTLSSGSATITGGTLSSANMIITNGNGRFVRQIPASAWVNPYLFPIGTAGIYSPVSLSFSAAAVGSVGAKAYGVAHPNVSATSYLNHYVDFSVVSGLATYTLTQVQLGYDPVNVTGTEADLTGNLWNGGAWQGYSSTVNTAPSPHTITFPNTGTLDATTFPLNNNAVTGRDNDLLYYRSAVATGNWEDAASWIVSTDQTFVSPAGVPATLPPNENNSLGITIMAGHTITVTAGNPQSADQLTVQNAASTALTIANGAVLTLIDGIGTDLTIAGTTARLNINGTLTAKGTISGSTTATTPVNGTYEHAQNGGTIPACTWNAGSTVLVSGVTTTVPSGLTTTFKNFKWNCPGQTVLISLGGAITALGENFTLESTGTNTLSLATLAHTATYTGNLIISGGTLNLNSGAAVITTLTINGNYNQTGGTLTVTATSPAVINFGGTGKTYTQSGGSVSNTNLITYNVTPAAASLTLLNDFPNVGTGRTMTITGTLNCGTNVVSGAGTFAMAAGGTLGVGSTAGISLAGVSTGNIQTTTRTYLAGTANYIFNGTLAQNSGNALSSANSALTLNVDNSNGVTTDATLLAANLTLTNGVVTTSNTFPLHITGQNAIGGSPSGTACVSGPMIRRIPASQAAALTLLYPLGKGGGYNPFEIINPTTSAGGLVDIRTEVFNGNSGGIAGAGLNPLRTNRYWNGFITAGSANLTSHGSVRLTETTPALVNGTDGIGETNSQTVNGTYNFKGGLVSGNTITTQTSLNSGYNYFNIGTESPITCPNVTPLKVGPTGDFTSLTDVATVLNLLPVNCDLTFEFQTTYNSSVETFPITFNQFTYGTGGPFTVTIRPETGATTTITGTHATALIQCNGADRIIIDGRAGGTGSTKALTISNTNTAGSTIQFINDATDNTLKYCTLQGVESTTLSGIVTILTTTGTTGNDNITIDNCDFDDGATRYANGIFASGTTTSGKENSNVTVSNCNFFNFGLATANGCGVNVGTGNTDWTISGNSCYQTTALTPTSAITNIGISVTNSSGSNFTVENNFIGGAAPNGASGMWTLSGTAQHNFCGIWMQVGTTTASNIQGNTINFISMTTASASQTQNGIFSGIYVAGGTVKIGDVTANNVGSTGANNISLTVNNAVSLGNVYGIKYDGNSSITIKNNLVSGITLTNSSAIAFITNIYGIYGGTSSSTSSDLVDISNNQIGTASGSTITNSTGNSYAGTTNSVFTAGIYLASSVLRQTTVSNNFIGQVQYTAAGTASSSGTLQVVGIYKASNAGLASTIQGNTIRSLSSTSPTAIGTTGAAVVGIQFGATANSHTISQNTIFGLSDVATAAVTVSGIVTSGASVYTIERNFIHSFSTSATTALQRGIDLNLAASTTTVKNNMVRLGINAAGTGLTTSANIVGILKTPANNMNFFHNTVYIGGTLVVSGTVNTACFQRTNAATDDIRNNIFVNARSNTSGSGKHYALVLNNTTTATCDYNIYHSATSNLYSIDGGTTALTTLLSVRFNHSGNNLNSGVSAVAQINFSNATGNSSLVNLHVNSNTAAADAGVDLTASVADDFDGASRTTTPEIGADEGAYTTDATTDVFTPNISYTALGSQTNCSGNPVLTATITDKGTGVPTSGGNVPRIYFRRFTPTPLPAAAWVSAAGVLQSGDGNNGTWNFTIDYSLIPVTPAGGETYQYFVVAQDQATTPNVWFSKFNATTPSGFTSVNTGIPTATAPASPDVFTVVAPLSGTVTVGTSGTYPSFNGVTGLFAALNSNGLSGDLTVQVISDITESSYTTLGSVTDYCGGPWSINVVPNSTNGGAGWTVTGTNSQTMLDIWGADKITFDGNFSGSGRYLTFRNSNPHPALRLNNGANNITIQNCVIQADNVNSTAGAGVIVLGGPLGVGSTGVNNVIINNNLISDNTLSGGYSKYLILSQNVSGTNSDITISDNELFNFSIFSGGSGRAAAIEVGTNGGGNYTITGNSIYNTFIDGTGSQTAIEFKPGSTSNGNTITDNYIGGSAAMCAGSPMTNNTSSDFIMLDINCGSTTGTIIQNNIIQNILQDYFDGSGVTAIEIAGSSKVNITGNTIGDPSLLNSIESDGGSGYPSSATGWVYGIYSTTSSPITIHDNTISGLSSPGSNLSYGNLIEHTGTGAATITDNTLSRSYNSSEMSGYNMKGIVISSNATHLITGNTISRLGNNSSGSLLSNGVAGNSVTGIQVTSTGGGTIAYNKLTEFSHATNGGFAAGIIVSGTGAWDVYNNMINMFNQNPNGVEYDTRQENYGILDYATGGTNKFLFNSVLVHGTQTGTSGTHYPSSCFYKLPGGTGTGNGDVTTVKNNIFINSRTGNPTALSKHYAIDNTSTTPSTNWTSDNNFLSANDNSTLGYWNGAGDRTFAQWQSSSAHDAQSVNAHAITSGSSNSTDVNPDDLFIAASTGDLHINTAPASAPYPYFFIYNAGADLAPTVTDDYDGVSRSTTPDIGAEEFVVCEITINATINGTSSVTVCNGTTVNLEATGAVTYYWTSNPAGFTATGASTTATPTVNTTYKVVGIDGSGCLGIATVSATVSPGVVTVNANPATVATGGTSVLTASTTAGGSITYTWGPCATLSNTNGTTVNATPTANTTYTVTATDASGCTATGSTTVSTGGSSTVSGSGVSCGYTFSYTTTAYAALSGATVLASGTGSSMDDALYPSQNIGFNFEFNGTTYTTLGVSTNGFVWFGSGTPSSTNYLPIGSSTGQSGTVDGIVAAFGTDLIGNPGAGAPALSILTSGTSPNRVFTIEWNAMRSFNYDNWFGICNNRIDFQIKLFEGTNVVDVRYRVAPYCIDALFHGQVGLRGSSTSDYNNRYVYSCSNNWNSSTAGISASALCEIDGYWCSTYPLSGAVYRFTPSSSGSAPTITPSGATTFCTGGSVDLTASSGASYQWYKDGVAISGATTQVLAGVNATGRYNVRVPATGCNPSSAATFVVVNEPVTPSVSIVSNPAALCGSTSATFTATAINGGCNVSYAWELNGGSVGTNSGTYNITGLVSGDQVKVVITSTAACASPATATSNTITVADAPTITLGTISPICETVSATTVDLPYSATTYSPVTYSIDFNAAAESAGFVDVVDASLPLTPIEIDVAANTPAGTYNANLTVKEAGGCTSNPYPIVIKIEAKPVIVPGANPQVCYSASAQTANLTYTVSAGTPDAYSLDFDVAAEAAGFVDVVNGSLPASPIGISVPAGVAAGTYNATLTVSNNAASCAGSGSYSVSVIILDPPSISIHPLPNTLCTGSNTFFTVTAAGAGVSYQWQEFISSWNDITNGGVYGGATSSTLTLTGVTGSMNGNKYRCVVSGTCSPPATSNDATLTVNTPPSISVHPADANVCSGADAVFSVTASGGGLNYSWERNTGSGFFTFGAANASSITVTGVTPAMNGYLYRVIITGACAPGTTSNNAVLNILEAPSISIHPANQNTCVGGNATFTGTASGAGLGYQWQEFISSWIDITNGGIYSGATSSSLVLTGVTGAMNGYQYRVIVSGTCSPPATSNPATLSTGGGMVVDAFADECMSTDLADKYLVNVSITGGTAPYSFSGSPVMSVNGSNKIYEEDPSGTYTYTVTDNAGCVATSGSVATPAGHPTDIEYSSSTGTSDAQCYNILYNKWMTLRNKINNKTIASVHSNGQDLGLVKVSLYVDAAEPVIQQGASNNCWGTQYVALKRHYVITTANTPSGPVKVRLYFTLAERNSLFAASYANNIAGNQCRENDDINNISQFYMTKYSKPGGTENGDYSDNDPAAGYYKVFGDNNSYGTTAGALDKYPGGYPSLFTGGLGHDYVEFETNSFSEFWLHGSRHAAPLPVTMLYFEAEAINNSFIQLRWATSIEINNDGFQVERSEDGNNWTNIGWVDGHDNSTVQQNYSFNDYNVVPKVVYYYRLKQMDNDGQFEYTEVVSAMINTDVTFHVADFVPNPTNSKTNLIITASQGQKVRVEFFNVIGQKVYASEHTLTKGVNSVEFNLGEFAAGTYNAIVFTENEFQTKKLVITK